MRARLWVLIVLMSPVFAAGQNLDPGDIAKPLGSTWPTYNGDYSGRRFSHLSQINAANVAQLQLLWSFDSGNEPIKATPLMVDGILYFTVPDKAWAIDARTGRQIWYWETKTRGGTHIGHRGLGMYGKWLFLVTPDNYLVSLDAATGKERWRTEIADLKLDFFSTVAAVVIRNHVLVSPSIESTDNRGYLDSYDPVTGKLQWRWYATPDAGQPGAETWPNADAREHGGGAVWIPGTYDPQLNLYYFGTANPQPVMAGQGRMGDNLWANCIVALNPDTGKMAWYYQTTPHDTHDWDSAETPVLFDADIDGHPRKLLAQANRDGYFFVLDRTNGRHILTAPFAQNNWAQGIDAQGRPIRDLAKDPQPAGALVFPSEAGATNWFPPSMDPQTGFFYVTVTRSAAAFYLTDTSAKPEAWGGIDKTVWTGPSSIEAIDCRTGKVVWNHETGGNSVSGLLTTAGKLLFAGDASGNALALDPASGKTLWHVNLNQVMFNGPITYELDGRQYMLLAAWGKLFAFALPKQ
ncbi:MAG TPA: acido-empty-quinoprotein group A [Terriglobales bacterium]